LSLGFDLPSVTGSVADIFGTMNYMSPEQFFNFSLVRETTDVYSIGKILFEVVEGKISDKVRPLKQVRLSNPDTDFRAALNRIIMDATVEDPKLRIPSAKELKNRLSQLLYCPGGPVSDGPGKNAPRLMKRIGLTLLALIVLIGGAMLAGRVIDKPAAPPAANPPAVREELPRKISEVKYLPYPEHPMQITQTADRSILRLIPPARFQVRDKDLFPVQTISVDSFYMSETPITNQQYVNFLNSIADRVRVEESEVYLDDALVLKLSEKIHGYKPVVYENNRFVVKDPMHSACAVLMVTGFGAEVYADHYGMRLPTAREWFFVMQTGNRQRSREQMSLPTPVINYEENKYGLRGINQVAEWGKNRKGEFVILGQAPSEMVEVDLIETKNPTKYYTDTSFRVAMDLPK